MAWPGAEERPSYRDSYSVERRLPISYWSPSFPAEQLAGCFSTQLLGLTCRFKMLLSNIIAAKPNEYNLRRK